MDFDGILKLDFSGGLSNLSLRSTTANVHLSAGGGQLYGTGLKLALKFRLFIRRFSGDLQQTDHEAKYVPASY